MEGSEPWVTEALNVIFPIGNKSYDGRRLDTKKVAEEFAASAIERLGEMQNLCGELMGR